MSFKIVINQQIKGVIAVGIVSSSRVDLLVACPVEDSPLTIVFPKIYRESFPQAKDFVACHLSPNLDVVITENEGTFNSRKENSFGLRP